MVEIDTIDPAYDTVADGDRNAEDVGVEKLKRGERLVLRGASDVRVDGEVREELSNLLLVHLARVAPVVEVDESTNPSSVGLFGRCTEVPRPNALVHFIHERHRGNVGRSVPLIRTISLHCPSIVGSSHAATVAAWLFLPPVRWRKHG